MSPPWNLHHEGCWRSVRGNPIKSDRLRRGEVRIISEKSSHGETKEIKLARSKVCLGVVAFSIPARAHFERETESLGIAFQFSQPWRYIADESETTFRSIVQRTPLSRCSSQRLLDIPCREFSRAGLLERDIARFPFISTVCCPEGQWIALFDAWHAPLVYIHHTFAKYGARCFLTNAFSLSLSLKVSTKFYRNFVMQNSVNLCPS